MYEQADGTAGTRADRLAAADAADHTFHESLVAGIATDYRAQRAAAVPIVLAGRTPYVCDVEGCSIGDCPACLEIARLRARLAAADGAYATTPTSEGAQLAAFFANDSLDSAWLRGLLLAQRSPDDVATTVLLLGREAVARLERIAASLEYVEREAQKSVAERLSDAMTRLIANEVMQLTGAC